jgi:hypothetical protein
MSSSMSMEFKIAAAVLVVFVIYVVAKVLAYMRASDAQWKQVDKSKLKEWEDDD